MDIIFTPTREQAKLFPPVPVKKELPDWYKDMPSLVKNSKLTAEFMQKNNDTTPYTVKRCVPVQDYLTSGYALKMPQDVLVTIKRNGNEVEFYYGNRGEVKNVSHHIPSQMPMKIQNADFCIIKFFTGWKIKTPKGYSSMIYSNFYNFEDRFNIMPAVVDTDLLDEEIGFTAYIKNDVSKEIMIEAGTTIATVFPFKRESWKMRIEEQSTSRFAIYNSIYFENAYRKFFNAKKKYD